MFFFHSLGIALHAPNERLQVDLREAIALMQSYGDVKHQQPFPQYRSTHSGRIAPSLTSTAKPIAKTTGSSSSSSAAAASDAAAGAALQDAPNIK